MAKKKKEGENAAESSENGKKKSSSLKVKAWLAFTILVCVIFLPTSMLLFIGMLPSVVAFAVSGRAGGARVSTITAMNLAGCVPFIFKLWSSGNDFEASFDIVSNARFISVMYMAAAFGYLVDWVVTGIVSSFLYQRGVKRMGDIKKRQKELVEQWGEGVDEQNVIDFE